MALVCQGAPDIEVVLFLAVECPISNRFVPELRRLAKSYPGVRWQGVFPDRDLTPARLRKWESDYSPGFPVGKDYDRKEKRRARATRTPEAAVYVDGRLVYRGRIDDRYQSWGRSREEPTKRDLADVIEAALRGEKLPVKYVDAVGCFIEN